MPPMNSDEPGKYSRLIEQLTRYLNEKMRYRVELYCLDLDAAGRCDYERRLIQINEPSAPYAFLTLAHEMGHALHGDLVPDLETSCPQEARERAAWRFAEAIVGVLDPASLGALRRLQKS
mgnify:CR=1 FL=1